jgi:phosphoglycolate phosphatase-like HAD superfamily hydrolase
MINKSDGIANLIRSAGLVFWDFDGVIKDSVDVKTEAYINLFDSYGHQIVSRIKRHHESNGGLSRYVKIPLYLAWAGEPAGSAQIEDFCNRFSLAVQQAVIEAPWVSGVREYILRHFADQYFILLTATPQKEIEHILVNIGIEHCFREVYGAPNEKISEIEKILNRLGVAPQDALMIGDSLVDLKAAQANSVPFLLRSTPLNFLIQIDYFGPIFNQLDHE